MVPAPSPQPRIGTAAGGRRRVWMWTAGIAALVALVAGGWWASGRGANDAESSGRVLQTLTAGNLIITLRSDQEALRQGRNSLVLEFRSAATQDLVDVGAVHLSATMTMPGMVMPGTVEIQRAPQPGRYAVIAEFGMTGVWRMAMDWNGPAGRGQASFDGDVR